MPIEIQRSPCPLCNGNDITQRRSKDGEFAMLCNAPKCGYAIFKRLEGESGLTDRERLVTFWNQRANVVRPKPPSKYSKQQIKAALEQNWKSQGSFHSRQPFRSGLSKSALRNRSNKA